MVRRSLVFKSYVYASVVFFASLPLSFAVGHQLMEQGRRETFKSFIAPQLRFVRHELEQDWNAAEGPPAPRDLDEMGLALHHRLRFVPWGEVGGYPDGLASQPYMVDATPRDGADTHWVRIDHAGRPVGAVSLTPFFGPGGPSGPGGPPKPPNASPWGPLDSPPVWLAWALVLFAIIVPPLWFWVIRPLRAMAGVASRLGGGDLDTPVAVDRKDEFGELQQAFETMRVQLRTAMELKERLLLDVSHEIRGPLSRMMLAVPLLRQQGADGPFLALIEREVAAADALLRDVLSLARGQRPAALAQVDLDLAGIAAQLVGDRAVVLAQRRQTVALAAEPAPVRGDPALLARALGNLIDNAIKYTPEGGHLEVATAREGDRCRFVVRDDGPGIAPEHLPRIFDPFYRPDDSRSRETGGTGLGLSIVRGVVESHGGAVTLDSRLGEGTTATIALPAAAAEAERTLAAEAAGG